MMGSNYGSSLAPSEKHLVPDRNSCFIWPKFYSKKATSTVKLPANLHWVPREVQSCISLVSLWLPRWTTSASHKFQSMLQGMGWAPAVPVEDSPVACSASRWAAAACHVCHTSFTMWTFSFFWKEAVTLISGSWVGLQCHTGIQCHIRI